MQCSCFSGTEEPLSFGTDELVLPLPLGDGREESVLITFLRFEEYCAIFHLPRDPQLRIEKGVFAMAQRTHLVLSATCEINRLFKRLRRKPIRKASKLSGALPRFRCQ